MKKNMKKNKAILIGLILMAVSMISRNVSEHYVAISISIFVLSIGVGFTFSSIFSKDDVLFSDVKKYMLVPLSIGATIAVFKKFQLDMPIIEGLLLFGINVLFFKKEIKKALKNL